MKKPCSHPGCRKLINGNGPARCPDHQREQHAVRNADRARRGLHSAAWRQLRAAVLDRDHHRCRLRLPGCTHTATEAHLDAALHGNHNHATLDNTVAACKHCNVVEANNRRASTPGGRAIIGNGHSPAMGSKITSPTELVFG